MTTVRQKLRAPRFPDAPGSYDRSNEAEFRRAVEQTLVGVSQRESKVHRIPYAQMVAADDTVPWSIASGYLQPNSTAVTQTYVQSVLLPKGVVLTGFRARLYRETASESAVAALWQGSDTTGLATKLADLSNDGTGWQTKEDLTLETEVGDETYTVVVQLHSTALAADARFLWAEPIYLVDIPEQAI